MTNAEMIAPAKPFSLIIACGDKQTCSDHETRESAVRKIEKFVKAGKCHMATLTECEILAITANLHRPTRFAVSKQVQVFDAEASVWSRQYVRFGGESVEII